MTQIKVFYKDESAAHPGKYMIRADLEKFYLGYTEGSYNIIGARLMGLDYPDYLRMCRDIYGAEIVGKDSIYPFSVFKLSKDLDNLINELNNRANLILEARR